MSLQKWQKLMARSIPSAVSVRTDRGAGAAAGMAERVDWRKSTLLPPDDPSSYGFAAGTGARLTVK
jgi:hypothetical protein